MECPFCGGPGEELGTLGRNTYERCQDCGGEFTSEAPSESYDEEGDDLFDDENWTNWCN